MRVTRLQAVFLAALALAVVLTGAAVLWLKAEHTPSAPIALAQQFVAHLHAKQYAQAHQLTLQNGYVGKTAGELEEIAVRQLCPITRYTRVFPFQSNGNRLRRALTGAEIEMPEIHVEFEGGCLFGVKLQRVGAQQWKVFRFASHAG